MDIKKEMDVLEEGNRLQKALNGQGYELTDAGNGELIADFLSGLYIYVPEKKSWLYYNDKVWCEDTENTLTQRTVKVFRQARQKAAEIQDTEKSLKLFNWYAGSENQRKLNAALEFTSSIPFMCARIGQFDKNDMLLNCLNGTVDLKTGEMLKHDRSHYITKICNANYNPEAKSDVFDTFLNEITEGNQEKRRYLQKLCGYCCTAKISEEEFYQARGSGQNGKTKLFETVKYCLGSYAITASPDILMSKDMTSIPNDIARLQSSRMVLMSEPDPGKRFSDNAIKSLTGGDTIVARFLHKEFFEFSMKAKIIMLTNHEIKAIGTDHGLWRRMVVIPFTFQVPEDKKDKYLQEKLIAEAETVLAWMVQGCLLWQKEGLEQPQELVKVKNEYRVGQDAVGLFIEECCIEDSKYKIAATELYSVYKKWCESTGEYELSQREFGKRLREKGFTSVKSGVYYWFGIGLMDLMDKKTVNSPYKTIESNLPEISPSKSKCPEKKKEWWEKADETEEIQ